MFGLDMLDVGIGVVLVYLLFSLILTAGREALEGVMKSRGKDLERGLLELLGSQALVQRFYDHPLVSALFRGSYTPGGKNLPSYIPSNIFAQALMDMAGMDTAGAAAQGWSPADIQKASEAWVTNLRPILRAGLQRGAGALTDVQAEIEVWYNSAMDRISGWYKQRTQSILFLGALAIAVGLNVNTISIVQALKESSALREAAAAQAKSMIDKGKDAVGKAKTDDVYGQAKQLGLPIGWSGLAASAPAGWNVCAFSDAKTGKTEPKASKTAGAKPPGAKARQTPPVASSKVSCTAADGWTWAGTVVEAAAGWLLTALALMMGAPFWFDSLSKLIQLRNSVKPGDDKSAAKPKPAAPAK